MQRLRPAVGAELNEVACLLKASPLAAPAAENLKMGVIRKSEAVHQVRGWRAHVNHASPRFLSAPIDFSVVAWAACENKVLGV